MAAVSDPPGLADLCLLLDLGFTAPIVEVVRGSRSHDDEVVGVVELRNKPKNAEDHVHRHIGDFVPPDQLFHLRNRPVRFDFVQTEDAHESDQPPNDHEDL